MEINLIKSSIYLSSIKQIESMKKSQGFSFSGSVHVWPQDPFLSWLRLVDQSQRNLIQFHFKPRAEFVQLYTLIGVLLIGVVPERDQIISVWEGDDSLALYFGDGEQVFQYVDNSLT